MCIEAVRQKWIFNYVCQQKDDDIYIEAIKQNVESVVFIDDITDHASEYFLKNHRNNIDLLMMSSMKIIHKLFYHKLIHFFLNAIINNNINTNDNTMTTIVLKSYKYCICSC
jgi:hypothetical protein